MEEQLNEIPEQKRGSKRTQRYSAEEKLQCLKRLEDGEDLASISKDIGPTVSTLKKWKREKNKSQVKPTQDNVTTKQPLDVYSALHSWWETQRLKGAPVLKTDLECQAVCLKVRAGSDAPESIEDILSTFMRKASVEYSNPVRVKKIPITDVPNGVFTDELANSFYLSGLSKCQVFNFAEISWNFKRFPGFKVSLTNDDDYIQILSISNADQTLKIPLIITQIPGETKWWKNEYNIALYSVDKIGQFVDHSVVSHWFEQIFVPEIKKYYNDRKIEAKALLIFDADKFKALPKNIDHISCFIASKKYSYLVSPFDDGLLDLMKQCKRSFLTKLHKLLVTQPNINFVQHLASIEYGALLLWVLGYWKRGVDDKYREPSILDLLHQIQGFEILTQKDIDDWMADFITVDSMKVKQLALRVDVKESPDSSTSTIVVDPSTLAQGVYHLDLALQFIAKHNVLVSSEIDLLQETRRRLLLLTEKNKN